MYKAYQIKHEYPNGTAKVFNFESYDAADKAMQRMEQMHRRYGDVVIAEPDLFYAVTSHGFWHKFELDY